MVGQARGLPASPGPGSQGSPVPGCRSGSWSGGSAGIPVPGRQRGSFPRGSTRPPVPGRDSGSCSETRRSWPRGRVGRRAACGRGDDRQRSGIREPNAARRPAASIRQNARQSRKFFAPRKQNTCHTYFVYGQSEVYPLPSTKQKVKEGHSTPYVRRDRRKLAAQTLPARMQAA